MQKSSSDSTWPLYKRPTRATWVTKAPLVVVTCVRSGGRSGRHCVSTVTAALFPDEFIGLQPPTDPAQKPTGKSLLIWGGASSVGSCAMHLAVAAGYKVIITASARYFDYVKKLWASFVFDCNSLTVVSDLVSALDGKILAGALDTIGGPAWAPTTKVVRKSDGTNLVVTTIHEFPEDEGVTVK